MFQEIYTLVNNSKPNVDTILCILSDDGYISGLKKADFDDLLSYLSLRNTQKRSARTVLGILLVKMRTGLSHRVLATLFGFDSKRDIGKILKTTRKIVMDEFVKDNIGLDHITREELITTKTTDLARFIFALDQAEVIKGCLKCGQLYFLNTGPAFYLNISICLF